MTVLEGCSGRRQRAAGQDGVHARHSTAIVGRDQTHMLYANSLDSVSPILDPSTSTEPQ